MEELAAPVVKNPLDILVWVGWRGGGAQMTGNLAGHGNSPRCEAGHRPPCRADFAVTACEHCKTWRVFSCEDKACEEVALR